ncbi:MAG: LPS export ABC transporter ATP-binding protein [Candidatus Lambdaproteobacteria bacterium RIFOXYD2_FULL_50_16]|uniref:LPS export ABC transporter ATP-binding protein n=1 Tax=Candidatus Lambdaproteobacteria bacterium RIFOXYD2_FULL_50_16 TaxID=1817772 RepID=A0A1F6GAQ8_9PROT|nr:MAG: LPS export ABC transporter ATP-binding protein [Candidatus Lambdaproteobacteria bacterium RIFOXYD2_FULL_50_16]
MLLETKNLVKTYGKRTVVKGVSFKITQGEVVGLLGANGAGKTTSFYMVVGVVRPSSGQIFLDQKEVTGLPMYQRARAGIGYLPQEASVFRKMTVEENLISILEHLGKTKAEQKAKADQVLEELHITHIRQNKGYSLSGGERRRVEIARALVTNPAFMLLDEPFAGVDPIAVIDIQGVIKELAAKGIGILITDHNVRETLGIVDRAYIMNDGQILVEGEPKQIIQDETAKKVYLGEHFTL